MKNAVPAMNTIPTTFNQRIIDRTILGGVETDSKILMPVTCLVLNRSGNSYRNMVFDKLIYQGFEKVIWIESNIGGRTSSTQLKGRHLDELSSQYPTVKFLVPNDTNDYVSIGDMINLGMQEAASPYVLVLFDDMCTDSFQIPISIVNHLVEKKAFCLCPKLVTQNQQVLPVRFSPSEKKSVFEMESSLTMASGNRTFYASDWAGLYNRDKFMQLGGIDYTITTDYWQKMDLFFRSWLWGEETLLDLSLSFTYSGEVHVENRTRNMSYLRFYLKNLLPVYRNEEAQIPLTYFFAFKHKNLCGLKESYILFKNARDWVTVNRYRFKTDAGDFIKKWQESDAVSVGKGV